MIERIINSIPSQLLEKVVMIPHPLMLNAIKDSNCELKKYLSSEMSYDEILKECKLLITDYSSISYDAFYRGSNVVFYWEEKDECLPNYGGDVKLMLTEEMAFGDVCYNAEELKNVIENNYFNNQKEEYKQAYKKIVEFDDNNNTNRIIESLKKDGVI